MAIQELHPESESIKVDLLDVQDEIDRLFGLQRSLLIFFHHTQNLTSLEEQSLNFLLGSMEDHLCKINSMLENDGVINE
ncbi:MAG: hypothetical protein AAF228_11815 [Pseudomonadota bacterium]